jgi:Transglycosylase SLT domain
MVTAVTTVVTVTAAAIGAMVYYHSANTADPLALVVAQVATGKSGALLEKERQQIIMKNAATLAFTVTSAPKITSTPTGAAGGTTGTPALVPSGPPPDPGTAQSIAYNLLPSFGFSTSQFGCLNDLWQQESGWRYNAENASGAYGIPQALPGSKMASAGPNWQTDPTTQIKWGLGYIKSIYGTPCGAWDHEEADGWY